MEMLVQRHTNPLRVSGDKTAVELATSRECRLTSIKEEFFAIKYAIGFPDQSPHTRIFSEQ